MVDIQKDQKGFTLVEIIVCLGVASILVVSLNSVTSGYLLVSQRGRHLSIANAFAEAKIEALRNAGYNNLALGSINLKSELPSGLPPSKDASMAVTSPHLGIKQVALSVSYKDGDNTRTYSYTTYIGELGVGQY